MKEQEIVHTAQRAFRETTGGTIADIKYQRAQIQPFDIMLQLRLRQFKEVLLAEVKHEVRKQDIPQIMEQFRYVIPETNYEKLLVAQYIPGPVKEELRKLHINYLEATGNCCIQLKNMFLFVNDRKAAPVRKTIEGKLWNTTGLKFLYTYLTNPEFLELPKRIQAKKAGIALGNTPQLNEELNVLIQTYRKNNAKDTRFEVLKEWGLHFQKKLRPRQELGNYRFLHEKDLLEWKQLPLPQKTWWGAEPGGAILTQYLRPENLVAYTRNKVELMKTWRLVPDDNGPLQLMEPFWPEAEDPDKDKTVNPVIVWAELNFDMDQRMRETADRIADKYFKNYDKRLLLLLK